MSSSKYHREQAEIFAGLALSTSNENEANWYKLIAKDQLERALREPMHKDTAYPETLEPGLTKETRRQVRTCSPMREPPPGAPQRL